MSSHTAQTELKLIGKLIVEGDIACQTGLHIGAGKGSLEIGGADNPVVKDAFGLPYIPGSSLRGKLRSLLEQSSGLAVPSELVYLSKRKGQEVRIHQSERPDDEVCLLFGRNPGRMERVSGDSVESSAATPARLTVYDAPLIAESITPQMRENMDDELTEVKSENAIDRITSQANPRTLERVPAGARFHFRIVMDVLCPEDRELLPRLVEGLRLLEDDSLGGGGSRGNGRVALSSLKLTWRGRSFYASGSPEQELLDGRRSGGRAVAGHRVRFRGKTRRVGMSPASSNLELRGSISSRGSVALRPGFRRARSRGFDLSQRRALLRGLLGDVAAGAGGRMAAKPPRPSASAPAVRFSSFFPFHGDTLLVVPPRSLWPPPESTKIRYKGAHFVPLSVIESLLADKAIDEDRWAVDGESECLVPIEPGSRAISRRSAIQRRSGPAAATRRWKFIPRRAWNSRAGPASGPSCNSPTKLPRRDGKRRFGVRCCCWPIPASAASARAAGAARKRPNGSPGAATRRSCRAPPEQAHWLLSLYTPAENDAVDWKRGNYATVSRTRPHRKQRALGRAETAHHDDRRRFRAAGVERAARRGQQRCARRFSASGVSRRIRGHGSHSLAGGGMKLLGLDCAYPHAGRRRPKAFAHRLHGLERPRQRSRSVAHLPAARQRPAPGKLSHATEESRQARLRLLGRLRAELRRPPHSV